ncbi:glutathione hydrolase 1 proenzyme-like [Diadema antillarum]|uniref:glutathione hydrolase 1 proenzyme-like n=1 Tax=Diadema antillarum TaxID=105358 RepID=UPI003A85CBD6
MEAAAEEVELEKKELLAQGGTEAGYGSEAKADAVTGDADVLTMEEFRTKLAQEGAVATNADPEEAYEKPKKGFGGSSRLAIALSVGLAVAVIFTIVLALVSGRGGKEGVAMATPTNGSTGTTPANGSTEDRSSVFQSAAVASDVDICSKMGSDILRKNGSAVDAAITTQLCIGLVNSQSSGLGGGFFMVIYSQSTGESRFLDARETAPLAANEAYVANLLAADSPFGIQNTAVPGEVRGLWEAHQKYGSLPWSDLFQPVIELAENGYRATEHLDVTLQRMIKKKNLSEYTGAWDIYMREDGSPKRAGDLVQNRLLAQTLRAIAANGSDEFYTGNTAQKLVQEIQELGGIITAEDLANYTTRWGDALSSPFGDGGTLLTTGSPSGGPVLQFITNVMQAFNLTSADFASPDALVLTYHRFLETLKFAYGLRSHMGDSDSPKVRQVLADLASLDVAREVAASIPHDAVTHTNISYYQVAPRVSSTLGGTSHLNVLAPNGDAVSSTTSVNYRFGSSIRSSTTGLIFNNEMADFSLYDTSPNFVEPGKRPLSAMGGLIVLDKEGKVKFVEGSAGSKRIISINAWMALATVLGDIPLSEAVDEPRIHCELRPPNIVADYEENFPQKVLDGLSRLGHSLTELETWLSVVEAILRDDDGRILAYSDQRKGGAPAGY